MMDFTKEDDEAVKWCEEKYPEIPRNIKKL